MVSGEFSQAVNNVLDSVVKVVRQDGGTGSGFILKDESILTCEHVVGGAQALRVILRDGRQINVDVLAADSTVDLAILRCNFQEHQEDTSLPAGIELAQIDLAPGQELVAVGHPLGLDWSVTGGHYNATRREGAPSLSRVGINLKTPLIQVDVVINQGNSGGPVIDREGHVVGVATGIINPAVANNVGFAIPVDTVMQFYDALDIEASTSPTLIPYNCGHHHPPGLEFCPLVGKAIRPVRSVAQEVVAGETPYSCGHFHPPHLMFCPLIGKPITPVGTSARGPGDQEKQHMVRYSCGHEHLQGLAYCPDLGKSIKPV